MLIEAKLSLGTISKAKERRLLARRDLHARPRVSPGFSFNLLIFQKKKIQSLNTLQKNSWRLKVTQIRNGEEAQIKTVWLTMSDPLT